MRVGMHVSTVDGISNAVDNALSLGCTAFQIFSRNPRGWSARPLDGEDIRLFKSKLAASGIERNSVALNMPFLPNLSGPDSEFYSKSVKVLAEEVERSNALGIPYLVVDLGSHRSGGKEKGMENLVRACNNAAKQPGGKELTILLQNSCGQKNGLGSTFKELREILDKMETRDSFGICFDTCHAFASGYDLRTEEAVGQTLDNFDEELGLEMLKLVHLNDSRAPLGANLDRHEHIGLGAIGEKGFKAFLRNPITSSVPIILQTPIDERRGDIGNLKKVLELAQENTI
jgi:deoxyribonuclease-4